MRESAMRESTMRQILALFCCSVFLISTTCQQGVAEEKTDPKPTAGKIDFVKDIQPLFRAKCYSCHGEEEQEAGLRLDLSQRALEGGDSGLAIVAGKSEKSPLYLRVSGLGEDQQMPPEGEGTPLNKAELAKVKLWIDQGAHWPKSADVAGQLAGANHWSFQPIQNPALPNVNGQNWVRNGIDHFILHKLEENRLAPSPAADRATLIRRAYLDVIGLPPSVKERQHWLNAEQSDWYEQLVDQLLASPHYGERWGRYWLDLARYADSDGYEKDRGRPHAWRWRNWVIQALNADMPFDQFTVEQLAGDLLPDATTEQKVATGLHRNTLINREGGIDPEEDRVKRTVDRTNTLGKIWLGMTVECAQCHTHKYDPITQREYYRLYAFFNSLTEPDVGAPLPEHLAAYKKAKAKFDSKHAKYVDAIDQYIQNKLPLALQKWEASKPEIRQTWHVLQPEKVSSEKETTLEILDDASILASGENPGREELYTISFETKLKNITAIRLETLQHKSLPGDGPGRAGNGNFVLTRFEVFAQQLGQAAKPNSVPPNSMAPNSVALKNPRATFNQTGYAIDRALHGSFVSGWAISPETDRDQMAIFETKQPFGYEGGTQITIKIRQGSVLNHFHNLGRFRIAVSTTRPTKESPLQFNGISEELVAALQTPLEDRSEQQQKLMLDYYSERDPKLKQLKDRAKEHLKKAPADPYVNYKAQTIASMPKPRKTHLLVRGDFLQPSVQVSAGTPAVLPPLESDGERLTRLDLARWIVSDDNPLTARVTANRIWQRYFGRGIVATLDDFGTQGDQPTHPELLDWLATQFRDNGWSLKQLHKLILTSATYRQQAVVDPKALQADPLNQLLSRQNRLRVDAEIVRDLALSASGLIKHKIGGPSVRPPQPADLSDLGYANSVRWSVSQGDDKYRRGLYIFFQRTVPYPMLMTFDAPDSNLSCVRRERSNTPLQALTLWNDPVFYECAQALGKRTVAEVTDQSTDNESADKQHLVQARIRHIYQLCLSRNPTEQELQIMTELYRTQKQLAKQDTEAALAMTGEKKLAADQAAEIAAWIMIARTVINLDEFITRG